MSMYFSVIFVLLCTVALYSISTYRLFATKRHAAVAPRVVHFVTTANPLQPYSIVAIDSVARYIPFASIRLHVITPEGANDTVVNDIEVMFEHQLQRFLEHPDVNLKIIMHPDVISEFIGTPLDMHPELSQLHFGGTLEYYFNPNSGSGNRSGTPFGPNTDAMVHASDTLRILFLYREGGMYLDTDYFLLNAVWPLVEATGNFVACETPLNGGLCVPCNAIFAGTQGSEFLWELLQDISDMIKKMGANYVYRVYPRFGFTLQWNAVGPLLLQTKIRSWIDNSKDVWTVHDEDTEPARDNRVRPLKFQTRTVDIVDTNIPIKSAAKQSSLPPAALDAAAVYLWPKKYFYPTNFADHTMDKPLTAATLQMYSRVYGTHLWESFKGGWGKKGVKMRNLYLDALMFTPNWTLVYIHFQACWLYCDAEALMEVAPLSVQQRLTEKLSKMNIVT